MLLLTGALIIVIHLQLSCYHAQTSPLYHLRIDRRAVPPNKLYQLHRRPWFQQLRTAQVSGSDRNLSWRSYGYPSTAFINSIGLTTKEIYSNPLHGSLTALGEYYVTLTFGGQPINVQIDTGSSTMAVPLRECTNCRKGGRALDLSRASTSAFIVSCDSPLCSANICTFGCGACSPTTPCCGKNAKPACSFQLRYADGSGTSGALVRAIVAISSLETPLVFGAMLEETSSFANDKVDGIFGLAYKSLACNPSCVTPLLDTLVQSAKVQHDIFSICTSKEGGILSLGGSNSNLYNGSLTYVPLQTFRIPTFYYVSIEGTTVGGKSVNLPQFTFAIIDSGTTLVVLPTQTFHALRDHFQTNYCNVPGLCPGGQARQVVPHPYYPHSKQPAEGIDHKIGTNSVHEEALTWFQPGYCVRLTEAELDLLPTISIRLEGYSLVIEPRVYMIPHYVTKAFQTHLYYCLGIQPLDGLADVIIGDTVLRKYFVEYDRENSRLGFAVAAKCIDSSAVEPATTLHPPQERSNWFSSLLHHGLQLFYLAGTIVILVVLINCLKPSNTEGYQPITS